MYFRVIGETAKLDMQVKKKNVSLLSCNLYVKYVRVHMTRYYREVTENATAITGFV